MSLPQDITKVFEDFSIEGNCPERRHFKRCGTPIEETVVAIANLRLASRSPDIIAMIKDKSIEVKLRYVMTVVANAQTKAQARQPLTDEEARVRAAIQKHQVFQKLQKH